MRKVTIKTITFLVTKMKISPEKGTSFKIGNKLGSLKTLSKEESNIVVIRLIEVAGGTTIEL